MHTIVGYGSAMTNDDDRARGQRLMQARSQRYESAAEAARALGISPWTYAQHENGIRGFKRVADRYAAFFRVNLEWLLTGRGEMRPAKAAPQRIPVMGFIGAGAIVDPVRDVDQPPYDTIELPGGGEISAYVVKGDSMRPRFLPGELILYDRDPVMPAELVGQYAIVQKLDGSTLVKILRRGSREGTWRLESLNAEPEEDVELLAAWRYLGVLPAGRDTLAPPEVRPAPKRKRR